MENFYNGMIRGKSVSSVKHPVKNKSFWIAASDYANLVSNAFKLDIASNKEYAAQGPEGFTMEEVAREFARNYSKDNLKVSLLPFGVMKFLGNFSSQLKHLSKLSEVNILTHETLESQNTWDELGKPQTTIAIFAKQQ